MPKETSVLGLLLDAPLQSWGDSSRFNHRGTAGFPSKSAVIGMLAAALGIDKYDSDEPEQLSPLAELRFHVARIPRYDFWGRKLPTLTIRDYHTIGANYDRKDPWESGMILRNAEGKMKSVAGNPDQSHTEVTERDYLADARFAVLLEGPVQTLDRIEDALKDPRWGVWLGRKSCTPALPLTAFRGPSRSEAFSQLLDTLRHHEARSTGEPRTKGNWTDFERIEDVQVGQHDQLLPDQPLAFGKPRHTARPVRHHRPSS